VRVVSALQETASEVETHVPDMDYRLIWLAAENHLMGTERFSSKFVRALGWAVAVLLVVVVPLLFVGINDLSSFVTSQFSTVPHLHDQFELLSPLLFIIASISLISVLINDAVRDEL
jgi:dolichyl-phosphate-mannose--protein O-mannosyl transferase